jgi:hypothetical protein
LVALSFAKSPPCALGNSWRGHGIPAQDDNHGYGFTNWQVSTLALGPRKRFPLTIGPHDIEPCNHPKLNI